MGYRSEVIMALKANVEIPTETLKVFDSLFGPPHETSEGKLFFVDQIKWYDFDAGHPCEVVKNFLSELNDEDFFFARVGDDTGDIEWDGGWRDGFDIYITTTICHSGPISLKNDIYHLSREAQKILDSSSNEHRSTIRSCADKARANKSKKSPDLCMIEELRSSAEAINRYADQISENMT